MKILPSYIIKESCKALLPINHMNYQTIVDTTTEKFYVKKTPFEIIKESCLQYFSSYEGRREAVKYMTGYTHKSPIPISTTLHIYAFPTLSPSHPDCIWFFSHHIKKIEELTDKYTSDYRTIVHFRDGSTLKTDISSYILKNQLKRAIYCKELYIRENTV